MQVEIDGEVLPVLSWPALLTNFPASVVTNIAYDVTRFAGQEVTLAISGPFGQEIVGKPGSMEAEAYLDGIQFVTAAPPLQFLQSGSKRIFSWPASAFGYSLQSAGASSRGCRHSRAREGSIESGPPHDNLKASPG